MRHVTDQIMLNIQNVLSRAFHRSILQESLGYREVKIVILSLHLQNNQILTIREQKTHFSSIAIFTIVHKNKQNTTAFTEIKNLNNEILFFNSMAPFPEIKSKHSLVAKHVTEEKWNNLGDIVTKTSGFTLAKAIACAVEFDNQHCGIYAGDEDSYIDFADVFDPLICEYHGLPADFSHVSDMDSSKITGNVEPDVPVHSCRYLIKTTFNIIADWLKASTKLCHNYSLKAASAGQ